MKKYFIELRNNCYQIIDQETGACVNAAGSFLVACRLVDELNGGVK